MSESVYNSDVVSDCVSIIIVVMESVRQSVYSSDVVSK